MSSHSSYLDVREVWLTNMCLLGFNPASSDDKFNKDMFAHINRKGSEVVLHFLFSKLDSKRASEEFKYCWPYFDKKQEQEFRKTCTNWVTKIAKEQPQSKLPRMSASLFLSPGGDKFYQFLLRLSMYVLRVACLEEAKAVAKTVFLSSFVASGKGISDVQSKQVARYALQAHIVQHNSSVLERAKVTCSLHTEWEKYATQLVWEHRELSKKSRSITKKLLALEEERKQRKQDRVDSSFLDATVASKLASGQVVALSAEVQDKRRKSRIKKVREMWRSLEKVMDLSEVHREMVDCMVEDRVNQYAVDARDIALQIPDVIVKEYESLSREGKAENTYQAGKINLICLVQMWKCSLQLIRNHLMKDGGTRSFKEELDITVRQLQTHRSHLSAARNLRASLAALRGSVDQSIGQLEIKLRNHNPLLHTPPQHPRSHTASSSQSTPPQRSAPHVNAGKSTSVLDPPVFMPKFTIPTLGLGLIPPTPPAKAHELATPDMSMGELSTLTFTGRTVSTPLAVKDLSYNILQDSRLKHQKGKDATSSSSRHAEKTRPNIHQSRVIASVSGTHLEAMVKKQLERRLPGAPSGAVQSRSRVESLEKSLSQFKRRRKKHKAASETPSALGEGRKKPGLEASSEPGFKDVCHLSSVNPYDPLSPLRHATPHLKDSGIHHMSGFRATSNLDPPLTSSLQRDSSSVPHRLLMPSTSFNNGTPQPGDQSGSLDSMFLKTDQLAFSPDKSVRSVEDVLSKEREASYFQVKNLPRAHEILADQIAAAVANQSNESGDGSFQSSEMPATPLEQRLHSVVDTVSAMGTDAFRPHDLLPRTPMRSSTPRRKKKASVELGVSTKLEYSDGGGGGHVSSHGDSGSGNSGDGDDGSGNGDGDGGSGSGNGGSGIGDGGSGNDDGGCDGSDGRSGISEGEDEEEQGQPRSFASKHLFQSGNYDSSGAQTSRSSQVPRPDNVTGGEGGFFSDFSSPSLVSASGSESSELSQ